jgi:hypothetical protein
LCTLLSAEHTANQYSNTDKGGASLASRQMSLQDDPHEGIDWNSYDLRSCRAYSLMFALPCAFLDNEMAHKPGLHSRFSSMSRSCLFKDYGRCLMEGSRKVIGIDRLL